ncbi:hypothetical protein IFM89_003859 [Coptis chinensis]|uniref:Homeobox domain-containing protein n=1 Tax=Coptis chinensis TaxID=261450 RepID=A0A835HZX3_9MAGN|nr:hypothetical protein IFM89_003859 [Coptis chinensis]
MEWEKEEEEQQSQQNNGMVYVKVMTDEQMELLQKQIAVYTTICEQLVEMHKNVSAQQDLSGPLSFFHLAMLGVKLGNLYCDSVMTSAGNKMTSRQRWTPTTAQLQILERIFDEGIGTPSKQKIKEVTNELMQHGQISETNVYNWFQNRRARSKRKQMVTPPNSAESEVETEDDFPKEKKTNSENINSNGIMVPRPDEICFQSSEINSLSQDPRPHTAAIMFPSDGCSKSTGSVGNIPFYESLLSNSRTDYRFGKMEEAGSFTSYRQGEDYDMIG